MILVMTVIMMIYVPDLSFKVNYVMMMLQAYCNLWYLWEGILDDDLHEDDDVGILGYLVPVAGYAP